MVRLGNDCEAGKYVIADAVRFLKMGAGDITGVTAGTGLTGGATSGNGTLSVIFEGTGSYNTVARSNHNHDAAYVNVAEPTSITSAMIVDGTIVNADISSLAAIDISKLSGVASSTHNHDATYVNEGQASSITSAMIVDGAVAPVDVSFNYAGGVSKGGPATDLNCTGCVGSSDLLDGAVTEGKLSATGGGTSGQVLGTDGATLTWQNAGTGVGWDRYENIGMGAHYRRITSTTIDVYRHSDDDLVYRLRVRIWRYE